MTRRSVPPAGGSACLLLALSLAACGGGTAGERGGFAVRDSAGVRIAENAGAAWTDAEAWRVAAEPELEVGMMDGPAEYVLGNVAAVLGTADGGVMVADAQALALRRYDADGRHLHSTGRAGGGPGEFRFFHRVVRFRGDTVAITDFANLRTSFVAPTGEIAREEATVRDDGGFGTVLAYAEDGSALIRMGRVLGDPPSGLVRDTVRLGLQTPGADGTVPVGEFAGSESVFTTFGGGFNFQARAFGPCSCVAAVPGGFVFGSGETAEVVRYGMDGTPAARIRWASARRPVTPADVEAYRARELGQAGDRAWRESILGAMVYPEEMAVYGRIAADPAGNLWVQRYEPDPAVPSHWWVFDPDGRMLGTVEVPAGFRIEEIGDDHLLGVWRDDLGVQYVRQYALHKPRG